MTQRIGVCWEGDFGGSGSLAQVNVELALRVAEHVDLRVVPRPSTSVDARVAGFVKASLPRVDITIRHGAPPLLDRPEQGRWVWMQPWEYGPCLPEAWYALASGSVDAFWVYSDWVRDQLVENGLPADRVRALPLGVDTRRFSPDAPPHALATDKRCRLLYLGGFTHRKGIDILLQAYREAFTAQDDVVLVLKEFDPGGSYGPIAFGELDAALSGQDCPAWLRLPKDVAPEQLPGIYTACTALVHPYRAEGFCLPMAEAMSCGRPVIATDRGGASMFATTTTAHLLPSALVHLPSLSFGRHQLSNYPGWREASRRHLVDAMREVYAHPERFAAKVERARQLITREFTWDTAARHLLDALHAVLDAPPRGAAPGRPRADAADALSAANRYLEAGDLDAAAASYHRVLGPAVERPMAAAERLRAAGLAGLGRVAHARGIPENAHLFHRLASQQVPADEELGLAAAEFAILAGHHGEALSRLRVLLDTGSGSVRRRASAALFNALIMAPADERAEA